MLVAELKTERARLRREMEVTKTLIRNMKGNLRHACARLELRKIRCKLSGEIQKLTQHINKQETESELLELVSMVDLNDEDKARYLDTLRRLQGVRLS